MSRTPAGRRRSLAVVGGVALTALLAACSGGGEAKEPPAASPPGVDINQASDTLEKVTIGVVLSLSSAPGEGSEWREAAEGAQVAAFRFARGGTKVDLRPVDDKGTSSGAKAAVQQLVDDNVAGIVMATSGQHLRAGLDAASRAGVPVVLPYAAAPSGSSAWSLAPTDEQVGAALSAALDQQGRSAPYVVDAGGGLPPELDLAPSAELAPSDDGERLATMLGRMAARGKVDAVVVSGPAQRQATMVAALQGAGATVPVLLTPDALSPVFAASLDEQKASLSANLMSAGADAGDVGAMAADDPGAALSAYFAALRATAQDGSVTTMFDQQPFDTVAADADTRSHDAVMALVDAAVKAESTDPGKVMGALRGSTLGPDEGIAGPVLDFGSSQALPADQVVPLQATADDPGVRGTTAPEPALFWFTLAGQ